MKRSFWTRALALLLVFSMFAPEAAAAGNRNNGWSNGRNKGNNKKHQHSQGVTQETTPETTPETTAPESTDSELTLVESATTVDNGTLLRASTYALTSTAETDEEDSATTVKYFPVTMYDYNTSAINEATDKLDNDLTVCEGIYFSDGSPSYETATDADLSAFVAGQYYIQNIRASENNVGSWLYSVANDTSIRGTTNKNEATVWTLVVEDDAFYLKSGDKYLVVGTNGDTDGLTETKTAIEITAFSGNASGVQLSQNGYYLCQWGGTDSIYYGGYNVNNDGGNGMLFYPVNSDTPIAPSGGDTYISSGYEAWNRWDKATGVNANGDLIWTGLVQSNLVNDQIVFNVNEGGIFDNSTDVKDIYEYVGLPFVLNTKTGVYSFDSDKNGVYFADTDSDGDADPRSGTAEEPCNLYFDEGNPQPLNINVGDGSTNAFFPYNIYNSNSSGYDGSIDYHFGMRADLPFSMTPNGRVQSTNDNSTPITFTFSGDDDVWVFIDGHLVIDLGGIHNRLDATIDFANNTITYYEENAQDADNDTASYNDSSFSMTQQLFTENGVEGVIPMSRDAFALDPDHEMQVFYLERGEGTSNCRIEFNLPMNDTVIVTKDATKSWSQAAEKADLEKDPYDEDAGVDELTAAEQAIINNIDFGFTLYKKTADAAEFTPVANTNFYLIGRGVESVIINQTDANGHFYLKNGQSAKFITELPTDGVTYYVVEDQVPDGFISPDFNFAGAATYEYTYTGSSDGKDVSGTASAADASEIGEQIIPMPTENEDGTLTYAENKSYEVTVKGSIEANDSIEFICSNYLDAELPNPTALTYEDIIVIDYGLPVNIDPLANDVFRGDDIEIVYFGNDNVTLTETTGEDGVVTATWTGEKTFHSGSVVLNEAEYSVAEDGTVTRDTFTYTLNKQLTEVEVITYIIKVTGKDTQGATGEEMTQCDYAIGKIYIVPATVMYYEENFSNLVSFTGSYWGNTVTTDGASDYQEPGVVGTTTDSIYGSDVAYLNDSYDSNGTSKYADTSNGAVRFQYTFTGTGTTIFARTSATTGYIQVKLYKGDTASGNYMSIAYRDTYWKDENLSELDASGILYNIPVYTQEDLEYGTYTVVVTVAKAGTKTAGNDNGSGKDFYLDGIRIMQPLNEDAEDETLTEKALGAYATDGEANIDTVTLRYKLITDNEQDVDPDDGETETEWPFAVMTDVDGAIVYASDYISIGPKEEVYLLPGQSVSFSIKYWHQDGYRMHMGMKAPFGSATVQVGQTTFDLKNAADCYYDITGMHYSVVTEKDENGNSYFVATYTFTATDKIVSLTNIKLTGNYEFVLVENDDIEIDGGEG